MDEDIFIRYINNMNYTDLNLYQCGTEKCKPDHSFGPAIRDHYLIHFITSGQGVFNDGQKEYNIKKNEGFLICPGKITYYEADNDNPWSYMWVGFHGVKAKQYLKKANLSFSNPIFNTKKSKRLLNSLHEMIDVAKENDKEARLIGLLYIFLSYLIEINDNNSSGNNKVRKKEYINRALDYISKNYSHQISVDDIASYLGLHRSYLYTLFKNNLQQSPQEYLINFRINKACELMDKTDLTIGNIARSVGYKDPLAFSKIFKKKKEIAPSEYRI